MRHENIVTVSIVVAGFISLAYLAEYHPPKVTEPPMKAINCDSVDYQGRNICKVVNVSEGVLKWTQLQRY